MSIDTAQTSEIKAEDELYLIDGSGFIFRAYYAMAYSRQSGMTNPDGIEVGAVYGFVNMLLKMLNDYHAPYLAVIFDAARENYRNEIYADYKANRDETPEDLIPQFALIREATKAFDMPALELEGYEADDLIAAYTKTALAQGKKVVIVSSDKDLMQLVQPGVRMLDPMKGQWIGEKEVFEKFGVTPDKVVDVQSLAGDSVDNIPGVPGIGIKTAAQLINEFGSLEELLNRAHEIPQKGRREKMLENIENARISQKLVKLDDNAPLPLPIEELKAHDPDKPDLMAFLQKHAFNSIIKRLGGQTVAFTPKSHSESHQQQETKEEKLPPASENKYTLINDEKTLREWMREAEETGFLAIDTETTSLTPAKAKLVGISISSKIGKAAYIPLGHIQEKMDLFGDPSKLDIIQLEKGKALEIMRPYLEDESILKIGHNMKYDWQMFYKEGVSLHPVDDTMLISYVLDGTQHSNSMDNLSIMYCDHTPIKYEEVAGKGKSKVTFDLVPIEDALTYAAEDAEITLRLHKILKPRLAREKMVTVYETIERPLIPVIARMEFEGIKVDPKILSEMSTEFGKKLVTLEEDIHKLAGHPFNVASPKQVGEILFDEMGLQGGKKTKTGVYSTSIDVLEKLSLEGHEIVTKILEHRQLAKLKSTYTDALQEQINPASGRVHTSYHMAGTSTGRLASSDPNLQNIPIRTEEGRAIRKAFIAKEGHVLLSVDYSQVELRLCAEMAGVEALKKAFKDGVDIHALTASQVFDVPLDQVTPEIRRQAKAVNFGIIYGISGFGLAKQLGCGPGEANEFIKKYLSRFHEIEAYMENTKEEAKKMGYVHTLYGRKCYIPGIQDKNPMRVRGAERQAINAPLQGTAADIMKIAMGKMEKALKNAKLSGKMLLQVHDELIFEIPIKELEKSKEIITQEMENSFKINGIKISTPLDAEAGQAQNWADAH
ncbi:MAG: DNA polymerase I [Alphaproteobacteria bacterium]|nr:DNA polymerase I [Alphaproteobacteria bacterium]